MDQYVPRTLSFLTTGSQLMRVQDDELINSHESIVVLGEPGMGKTRLLRHVEGRTGWTFRSAPSFVSHPSPEILIPGNGKVIIDGLDELSASQEGDAVHRVLGQLIKAGRPRFILSCRAADWRGALARQDLGEEYGVSPLEMTLEPFSSYDAQAFLAQRLNAQEAERVIDYLDQKGLSDLYGNPLTLTLMGEVVEQGKPLPETRVELMERAVDLMWSEHNPRKDQSEIAQLDKAAALNAAGAACAAFILTGAESISDKPRTTQQDTVVRIADLQALPGGGDAKKILGSRLFVPQPGDANLLKPIHRTVAEFLGADWLASNVDTEEGRDRVLGLITIDAGVPASVRGLHAWLARDSRFSAQVIRTDPYGVLRYGDADNLSVENGRILLRSLKALREINPFFRAEDWGHHSAKGLSHLELLEEVRDLLIDPDTGFHLRTLILSAIRGSALAAALSSELVQIVLSEAGLPLSYSEREEAAFAALALTQANISWSDIVHRLNQMSGEDSSRLAIAILSERKFEGFAVDLVAESVFAHLGLFGAPEDEAENLTVGILYLMSRRLPSGLILPLLDRISAALPDGDVDGDYRARSELSDFVLRLISRAIEEQIVFDPLRFLAWIRTASSRYTHSAEDKGTISDFLKARDTFRQKIHEHVVFVETEHENVWGRVWRLADLNDGLVLTGVDVQHILTVLAETGGRSTSHDEIWRDVLKIGRRYTENAVDIFDAAARYAQGSADLLAELESYRAPVPEPDWQRNQRIRRAKDEANKQARWAKNRTEFSENRGLLVEGDLRWVYPIAQAYLGVLTDFEKALPPTERVEEWLGVDLAPLALAGLEKFLLRNDLPTTEKIALSYAESRRWHAIYPMIAAVAERLRTHRSLDDLDIDLLIAVRIALHYEHFDDRLPDMALQRRLDEHLRAIPDAYERYIRLLIEPSLELKRDHVQGLYAFARDALDVELAKRLAVEWLQKIPALPVGIESQLTDILVDSRSYDALYTLAKKRFQSAFSDDQRRRNWQAIELLADFETSAVALAPVDERERDFLWHIRDRVAGGRRNENYLDGFPKLYGWIVENFRSFWPNVERPGSSSGDHNDHDAAAFIRTVINRLGTDTSEEAAKILHRLVTAPKDNYTPTLLYVADAQRRAMRERTFPGVSLVDLSTVLANRPPTTTRDLLSVLTQAIARLQVQLRGNDTDTVLKYWRDTGGPQSEDRCTDLLIEDLERLLAKYGIRHVSQADMPRNKTADIVFTVGEVALPVECKGQWNKTLWSAATDQLEALYMRDWRSQDSGLYLVYWFGPDVPSGQQVKSPGDGAPLPSHPDDLKRLLLERIPAARHGSIVVEVLDLTR